MSGSGGSTGRHRASMTGSSSSSSAHGSNGHGHYDEGAANAASSSSYAGASNGSTSSGGNGINGAHASATNGSGAQNGAASNGTPRHDRTNGTGTLQGEDGVRSSSPDIGDLGDSDAFGAGSTTFTPLYDGSSLDRREFLRLTLQSLRELGFESSARSLESESGITLEHPSIVRFRKAIMAGDWKNAERLLIDGLKYNARRIAAASASSSSTSTSAAVLPQGEVDWSLVLRDPQKRGLDSIKFLIYQQRYLELLETRQTRKALTVLRERLAPLNHGSERLHSLSSLAMCVSSEELRSRARWAGSGPASRRRLLEDIETAICPAVMIPSRRLPQLLEQAQQLQTIRDPFYNLTPEARLSLYVDHRSDRSIFPSWPMAELHGHTDEVWHIAFSHDGTKLASTGKEKEAYIWSVGRSESDFNIITKLGPLNGPICHVAWSPDDKNLLLTSDDGEVVVYDVAFGTKRDYKGHIYTVGCGCWMPDGQAFITCSMDGKVIFWELDGTNQYAWSTAPFRVQAMDASPDGKYLVAISHRPGTSASSGPSSSLARAAVSPMETTTSSGFVGGGGSGDWAMSPSSTGRQSDDWAPARSSAGSDAGGDFIDLGGGSRVLTDERYQIHFYDLQRREELGSVYMWDEMSSVQFSRDSRHVLINQRPSETHLWDAARQSRVSRYSGHRIQQFVIRSCFGGAGETFVVSGSEDGYVYVYHRRTGKLLERLRGHPTGSINSVAWHPIYRDMFASCGDDHKILIWRPPNAQNGIGDAEQEANTSMATTMVDGTRNGSDGQAASTAGPPSNGHNGDAANASALTGLTRLWLNNASTAAALRDAEDSSHDAMMGPSPFPWATSPRDLPSPTLGNRPRPSRRRGGSRTAIRVVPASSREVEGGVGASSSLQQSHENDQDDDDDEEEEEEEYEDEEEEEEEGEEDEDEEENEDRMEE